MERKNIYISNLTFNNQMVLRQLTKEQAKEEVKKLDNEINEEVYKLYGITDKEKEIIEVELGRFTTKNPVVKGDYRAVFPKSDQSDTLDEQAHSVTEYEQDMEIEQNLELRLREINETLAQIDAPSPPKI